MSKLSTEIERTKKKLITRAQKKGLYENFGDKEVREIKDKYGYFELFYGSPEQRKEAGLINDFDNWCMTFDLSQLATIK